MIMAAPFPSELLQNVQIFLPLTDLDHRTHSWGCESDTHVGHMHMVSLPQLVIKAAYAAKTLCFMWCNYTWKQLIRCKHVNISDSTVSPVQVLVSHLYCKLPFGRPLRGERQLVRVAKQSWIIIIPVPLQGVPGVSPGLRRASGWQRGR